MKKKYELTVDLWFYSNAKFEADCYFWVTANGELPQPTIKGEENLSLVEELVLRMII